MLRMLLAMFGLRREAMIGDFSEGEILTLRRHQYRNAYHGVCRSTKPS